MLDKIQPTETLANKAYRILKQAIINNELSPGDSLAEEYIAEKLGISRTPIIKALNELAHDGLVDLKPGKKATVAKYTLEDLHSFLQMRELLEPFAAKLATEHMPESILNKLKEMVREQEEAIKSQNFDKFIEIDRKFHMTIAQQSRNKMLIQYIENLHVHLQRYLILSGTLEESAFEAYEEHLSILESFQSMNVIEVEDRMRHHMVQVKIRVLKGT